MDRLVLPSDARVFLGRLTHLNPHALVRLCPSGQGRAALWAWLPWRVLVTREVAVDTVADATFRAAELLAAAGSGAPGPEEAAGGRDTAPDVPGTAAGVPGRTASAGVPARRDAQWRWPLPPRQHTREEDIPAHRIRAVADAAAGTLREVRDSGLQGRPVGARMLREALLDHIPVVVVNAAGDRIEVPQRLVQAVVRMGFLGPLEAVVSVCRAGGWVGLSAWHGDAWLPPAGGPLGVRPTRARPPQ